jgi:exonuclease SbcC
LEINAFGPYADKQVIDFRELKERKLFLIYGPTGSGKTTVLDAMCYALYGKTSGNDRTGANMRSKYATPQQKTSVTFEFSIGDRYYRIERSPDQEIAKKRGTGTKNESASAALYALHADGSEKAVIATKHVDSEVEKLLGFKQEQFRQVVLLPQGDFRKLLLAGSSERQEIMQVLFHTERYGRFQELARQRYAAIESSNAAISDKIEQLLQLLEVADEQGLEIKRREIEEARQATEVNLKTAVAERDAYQTVVQSAQVLYSHWQALKQSRREMAALNQQKTAMEEKRSYIEQLKRAQLLAEPCKRLDEIQQQGTAAGHKQAKAVQQGQLAAAALQRAKTEQLSLEGREEEQRKNSETLVRLQGFVEKSQAFAAVAQRYDQEKAKAAQCAKELTDSLTILEKTKTAIQAGEQLSTELQSLLIEREKGRAETTALTERVREETNIAGLAQKLAAMKEEVAKRQNALTRLSHKAAEDKRDYEAVQALFLQGQASLLAQGLEDGTPCPVCGSLQHPLLAALPADLPQKEDVERRKKIADESEKRRQTAQVALEKLLGTTQEQQRQYEELRHRYREDGSLEEWQKRLEQACGQQTHLDRRIKKMTPEVEKLQALKTTQGQLEAKERDLRSRAEAAKNVLAATTAVLQQAERDLPEQYRNEAVLQQAIEALQKQGEEYAKALKAAGVKLRAAEKEDTRWQEQIILWAAQTEQLRKQYSDETAALKERVLAAGFDSVRQCREMQHLVPTLPQEEKNLAAYVENVQQTAGRIHQEEQAVGTAAEPDMEAYTKLRQEKNKLCESLAKETAALKSTYDSLVAGRNKIDAWHAEQGDLAEQFKTIGAVYELVSGKTTGINFERYVLGALLDDVLQAANLRLDEMSRNRYQLQRSNSWADRRVKQIGLDIEVFDNYTGYARPANTLSGGETFLASLSLALGLADVVQAYSGGIHLDTIFIDEGFGTLDSETLDFALKALLSLHQDGRLVGIISHVPELRERIDTRLAVHKTERGSTAAFELL